MMDHSERFYQSFKRSRATIADERSAQAHRRFVISRRARTLFPNEVLLRQISRAMIIRQRA
jgi:hypothetical protein